MGPTIHILGLGNLGKLFAHSLATKPKPPPVTLLLHRLPLYHMAKAQGPKIKIYQDGVWYGDGRYDVEFIPQGGNKNHSDTKVISNLIVTTKSHKMAEALGTIKHRLSRMSTVLFIHNGMGVVEEVNKLVFPNVKDRPHYLFGIASHGVSQHTPFTAILAGHGFVTIGNPEMDKEKHPVKSYLLRQVIDSKLLRASEVPWDEFRLLQLQKLAVNAVINPLTALNNCLNGMVVESSMSGDIGNLFGGLVSEISQVLCSLPELQGIPGLKERFSIESLRNIIHDVVSATAQNRSSMLQDVSNGRETEISYINGYIVERGKELGIECPVNRRMVTNILDAVSKQKLQAVWNEVGESAKQ
ncbi:311121b2-c101-41d6-93c8-26adf7943c39 [Sclerotinia trifoliorum]|uniref:2-dehydropantoate 2-reductase n=1 Tax=Sclerotinia trifoliorum TaxID=28548 RepID=A0A8H2W125_9HELO|nr:311121b2-c101-41d6-93c8-26adf7943c39 [Sclerotinia trifoliorum]